MGSPCEMVENKVFQCSKELLPYKCRRDNFQSLFLAHLKQHIEENHQLETEFDLYLYTCACSFATSSQYLILRHGYFDECVPIGTQNVKKHEQKKRFECKQCGYRRMCEHNLTAHTLRKHAKAECKKSSTKCMMERDVAMSIKKELNVSLARDKLQPTSTSVRDGELSKDSRGIHKKQWFCNRPLSPPGTVGASGTKETADNEDEVILSSALSMTHDPDQDSEFFPDESFSTKRFRFLRNLNFSLSSNDSSPEFNDGGNEKMEMETEKIEMYEQREKHDLNEGTSSSFRDETQNIICHRVKDIDHSEDKSDKKRLKKASNRNSDNKNRKTWSLKETKDKNKSETANSPGSKIKKTRQKDFCFYCETFVLNFARHLRRNHSREPEVERIFSKEANSKERKDLLTLLRKKGNFVINGEICKKPVKKPSIQVNANYLPCSFCLGYYVSNHLWRHRKTCPQRPKCELVLPAKMDAHSILTKHLKIDQRLREEVFPRMRADQISLVAKKDPLICAFGARYIKIHREKHLINVASRKMRELARILMEMRKTNPEIKTLFHGLQPKYFDSFIEAAKNSARYNSETECYESPTFLMNIGTSLKQCCDIAIMFASKKKEMYADLQTAEAEADLKTMIRLLESNWKFEISSYAADNVNIQK